MKETVHSSKKNKKKLLIPQKVQVPTFMKHNVRCYLAKKLKKLRREKVM